MFKKLGEIITKRPMVVIAIWALILIVSAALAVNLNSHLLYDTSSFTSNSSEPKQAQNLMKAVFPDTAKTQLIVAVQADNETARRAFISELNDTVMVDPSIHNVTNTTSVYDAQRTILEKMSPDIYHGLYEAMDNVSDGNHQLYNGTDEVINNSNQLYWLWDNVTQTNSEFYKARKTIADSSAQLYSARDQLVQGNSGLYQIHGAFDLIDGSTLTYAGTFGATYTGSNLDEACAAADNAAMTQVVAPITDPSEKQLAGAWVSTLNSTWYSEPSAGMDNIIKDTGTSFMSAVGGGMTSQEKQMFQGVIGMGATGANDYQNPSALKQDIITMAMQAQGLTSDQDRASLSAIYDLGSSPSAASIDNMVISMAASAGGVDQSSIAEIYDLGRDPSYSVIGNYLVNKAVDTLKSSDTGKNMSASDLQNATDVIQDAWNIGPTATKQDFDNYVLQKAEKGLNASEKQNVEEIWGWGRNPNDSVVRSFVLNEAGDGLNASENQSLAEVYDLGRNASNASIESYVIQKAADNVNITGNLSYFYTLMDPGRNLTDDQLNGIADSWASTHSFNDPQILPDSVTSMIESGNVTLYIIELGDDGASANAKASAQKLMTDVEAQLKEGQYKGVVAHVTGTPAIMQDMTTSATQDIESIDEISIPMIVIIMAVFFLSVVAPFVPLATIGVGLVTGLGALYMVTFVTGDLYNMAQMLLIVCMLGAGIDYCVFILSRYSEERNLGGDVKQSVVYAVEHAGKSITCSGIVAAIGFGSLTLIDHGIFMSIGISAAVGILVSLCVALTLLPAIITLLGDRVFWPRKVNQEDERKSRMGPAMRRISKFSLKHWKVVLLLLFVVLVPMTYIALQLQLGQDTLSMLPNNVESKAGFDMIESVFGSGNIDRTAIVVTMPSDIKDPNGNYSVAALNSIEDISKIAAAEPGVGSVYSLTRPYGSTIQYDNLSIYNELDKSLYQNYMDNNTGSDDRTSVVYVAFSGSPYSAEASNTITDLHSKMQAYEAGNGTGETILIGGSAASMLDYMNTSTPQYPLVVITVFVGILLILLYLLRSVISPPKLFAAMISVIVVTLGLFTLIFQFWMQTSIFWILPVALFCILVGLGGDYVIFMMSRVREEVNKGKSDEDAILDAVQTTGPVILLCGAVMGTAFGSMMSSGMVMIKELGFVLSIGIIMDATIMIWVLIPALMMAFKKYNWWFPGKEGKKVVEASAPVQEMKKN